jgi:hypothetical protein
MGRHSVRHFRARLGGLRFVVRHQSREADKSQDFVPDETAADRRPGRLHRVVGNVR